MANVLHRTTKDYLISVNTPDYDPAVWIINPDLSRVAGYGILYWKINEDDTVTLMNATERAQIDKVADYQGQTIEGARAIKNEMINTYRDTFLNSGWTYNGVLYDSDQTSTQNIAGTMTLINSGYVLPDDFRWRAKDNSYHTFTNQTFHGFFIAATMWREAAFKTSWAHKAAISTMTSIEEIAAYDFSLGWVTGITFDGETFQAAP